MEAKRSLKDAVAAHKAKQPTPNYVVDTITFECGHARPAESLKKRKCPACIDALNKASHQKKKKKPKPRATIKSDDGRLPDASYFSVQYSAEKKEWSGVLHIPFEAAICGQVAFNGKKSGVFQLLRELDKQYRDSLTEQEETPK